MWITDNPDMASGVDNGRKAFTQQTNLPLIHNERSRFFEMPGKDSDNPLSSLDSPSSSLTPGHIPGY